MIFGERFGYSQMNLGLNQSQQKVSPPNIHVVLQFYHFLVNIGDGHAVNLDGNNSDLHLQSSFQGHCGAFRKTKREEILVHSLARGILMLMAEMSMLMWILMWLLMWMLMKMEMMLKLTLTKTLMVVRSEELDLILRECNFALDFDEHSPHSL